MLLLSCILALKSLINKHAGLRVILSSNPPHLFIKDFRVVYKRLVKVKDQTKSKLFFQANVSSKNRLNEFNFTTMIPQVDLFSFIFLEEIEDTKNTFLN